MLDGPVELSMGDRDGKILVYRKMYGDQDAYITVGSIYANEHPDECTEDALEKMIDQTHDTGQKWDPEYKQMFRELFEFMVDD